MFTAHLICSLILIVCVGCQHPDYVLPHNVKPLRYVISILSINTTNFKGSVEIELKALGETSNITLHSKNIEINENLISITENDGKEIKWKDTSVEAEKEFYIINLDETLVKERLYNLTIGEFTGSLTEAKEGFFFAKFEDLDGNEKGFVVTEFEPSHARKAFPCFDQPNLKATFIMKIIRPSYLNSAFNTPLQETIDLEDGRQMDVFKETPVMSTYLVAFMVSDFKYTKPNGIIRILAQERNTQDGSTDFVLEESNNVLKALEEYTGVKYPLDKIDLVAIPQDYFLDGAMENWGLITFSDKYLVCPDSYPTYNKQKCLTFTVHELAHQWFGNLATQRAWNYIWLSEGFASYFQYYIADAIKPSWRIMEQYVLEEYETSLDFDRAQSTEAIDFVYTSPNSYPSASIYYRKASAIIRMIQHVLTDEIHRNGLRIYIQNNMFKNTEPIDVYNSYQEAIERANATDLLGNFTVHEILKSWVENPGYPLVTVTRDYTTGKVTFSQKVFGSDQDDEKMFWHIPITFVVENNKDQFDFNKTTTDIWLTNESVTIDIGINDGWVLVNKHAVGYYRVVYDERNMELLINFLRTKDYVKIPPVNRAKLLYDAYAMVGDDQLSHETLFNLTQYIEQEIDYIPLSAFVGILEEADIWSSETYKFNIIKNYLGKLLTTVYEHIEKLPKNSDSHMDGLCRNLLEKIMCKIDEEKCVQKALHIFDNWVKTDQFDVTPNLKKNWLCAVMKKAEASSWEFLLNKYYICDNEESKTTYIYALSCVKNADLLERLLKVIFDVDNPMRLKDRTDALSEIVATEVGADLFMKHIKTVNITERYCNYFSEAEDVLIPVNLTQKQEIPTIRKKTKNCLPIYFYERDEGNFAGLLSNWCQKYIQ